MNYRPDTRGRLRAFEALCRQRRLPLTVQRRAIFEALLQHDDHPTADQIYADVRPRLPGVSRTTVYRVLETLVRLGAAGKASHPGASARFDAVTARHHHLLCVRCDRLMDLDDDAIGDLELRRRVPAGFQVLDYSVHFRGVCADCRRLTAPARKRSGATRSRRNGG